MEKNNKKIRFNPLLIFGILLLSQSIFLLSASFADEIIVIGNKDVSVNSLSKDEIKSIFFGEKSKWNDGNKIIFVLLLTEVHENFIKDYLGTTPSQYRQYWKRMVFTGRARSPKSFKNPEKMIDYIAKTDGAVGYVPAEALNDRVKKISVK